MTGLTAAELSTMRTSINELLPDTCNILTPTNVNDGQGGITTTWGTANASVTCRLDKRSGQEQGQEQVQGAGVKPYTEWILTLPYDTTIANTQRVEVGSSTFNVISVDGDKSWEASMRVILEKV